MTFIQLQLIFDDRRTKHIRNIPLHRGEEDAAAYLGSNLVRELFRDAYGCDKSATAEGKG